MRKQLTAAVLLLTQGVLCAAVELTIPAGQTYTILPEQSDLRLERLTIGDNASIRFAEGVSRWRVEAKHVDVGSNVVIDGRAGNGGRGADGLPPKGQARDCYPGEQGAAGAPGAVGGSGVALVLWWGIDSLGSAKLLTDGGIGGAGGAGGPGQNGGKVNRCAGPQGGSGGIGGNGGAGGKGGDVSLSYYDASGKNQLSLGERLSISASGGQPGVGGAGAEGGVGAEGKFQRTATSEAWFAAGKPGAAGEAGRAGTPGATGTVAIQAVAATSRPVWALEAGSLAPADRGTVQSLQRQVEALQSSKSSGSAPAVDAGAQIQALQEQLKKLEQRVKALESR